MVADESHRTTADSADNVEECADWHTNLHEAKTDAIDVLTESVEEKTVCEERLTVELEELSPDARRRRGLSWQSRCS